MLAFAYDGQEPAHVPDVPPREPTAWFSQPTEPLLWFSVFPQIRFMRGRDKLYIAPSDVKLTLDIERNIPCARFMRREVLPNSCFEYVTGPL